MTKYLVLRQVDAPVSKVGEPDVSYAAFAEGIEAHSPAQALRSALAEVADPDGTYAVVPESNWKLLPVALKAPAPRLFIGGEPAEPAAPAAPEPPAEPEPDA